MSRFRKKPVVIEARQFDGGNGAELVHWINVETGRRAATDHPVMGDPKIYIYTLEGTMTADVGDWIIQGVAGEFYPCKPEIFGRTYEAAEGD